MIDFKEIIKNIKIIERRQAEINDAVNSTLLCNIEELFDKDSVIIISKSDDEESFESIREFISNHSNKRNIISDSNDQVRMLSTLKDVVNKLSSNDEDSDNYEYAEGSICYSFEEIEIEIKSGISSLSESVEMLKGFSEMISELK